MNREASGNAPRRTDVLVQRVAWAVLALTILLVLITRIRLREMPLERDEGEYAYAGQLILDGVPPYKLAYNMKLPGTYLAYAAMMAVFGQSSAGIHIGLAVVNIATIVLMFLLGKRLLDVVAGAGAALVYGFMSTSPALMGVAGHATHFVSLFAVGGTLMLLGLGENPRWWKFFLTGLLMGFAFLMKQPGIAFGIFAIAYVAWRNFAVGVQWKELISETGLVAAGLVTPYALTCLWLWSAGVLDAFWFWTVGYARQYVSTVPWSELRDSLVFSGHYTLVPTMAFWLLGAAGAVLMWFDRRLEGRHYFILGLIFAGILATGAGLYFRPHYFITMLPPLALVCGVAVSRSANQLLREKSVELFSALGVLGLLLIAIVVALIGDGQDWFGRLPREVSRTMYRSTIFNESLIVSDFIRANFPPDARIAVLGSEPQIYFYADRRSATGYIYTYGLMGKHPYARLLQEKMIAEIEAARPECVVYVEEPYSWLKTMGTDEHIFDWWKRYWAEHYELMRTVPIGGADSSEPIASGGAEKYFTILKRKDAGKAL